MTTKHLALLAALVATSALGAQTRYSMVVSPDNAFVLRNSVAPKALGQIDDQESIIVTPDAKKAYDARPFRTFTGINVMHGDGDGDGNLNDLDVYGDLNCLFRRQRIPHAEKGPFNPGSLWMSCSFNTTAKMATTTGIQSVRDGDVFRCRHGKLEFFLKETHLEQAFGGTGDIDIDGLAQDAKGNLYISLWVATITVGSKTLRDGDIFYIPASAITYDRAGMVTAIKQGAAVLAASEADVNAMVVKSKARAKDGTLLTAIGDLGGLNIDPNGGTWKSPQNASLVLPNLVFGSNFLTRFDNFWSTANGGSIAVINGKQIGYTTGKADGAALGIGLMSSQDATNAMVIIPEQAEWIAIDSPSSGGVVQGKFDIEVGRLQPRTAFVLLFSTWSRDVSGGYVPGIPLPGAFGNRFFEALTPIVSVAGLADANGYGSLTIVDPKTVPAGVDLLVQGIGFPFGVPKVAITQTSNITF